MRSRRYILGALLVLVVTASCSQQQPAPTAPVAQVTGVAGTVFDLGALTEIGTPGAGVQAPVTGIVHQISGACPALTFVIAGVTIHFSSATQIDGGTCADVQEGMRAAAMGTRRDDGSVDAARVKIASAPPAPVIGIVTALSGACPSLTFTLGNTTVHTSRTTVFEGGVCGDLQAGAAAAAMGPANRDGSINADHVRMAPPPPATASGVVGSLAGTCPSLTFVLSGTTIHTSATTTFDGGTCGDVKAGGPAGASGPKSGDGSINAERVRILSAPPTATFVTGTVISVTGSCPAVTFVIGTTTVHTSATTIFDTSSCGDLKPGVKAGATGKLRSDGSLDAARVRVAKP